MYLYALCLTLTLSQDVSSTPSSDPESVSVAGRGILFPIELWRVIFDVVGDESNKNATSDMFSILSTCTSFRLDAENVLYRRVSLTRNVTQLYVFIASVNQGPWRAAAVQSLRLCMPDLRPEDGMIQGLLQKLVNLVDLHVSGLGNPYAILAHSPFRLQTCRMNWDAFLEIHTEELGTLAVPETRCMENESDFSASEEDTPSEIGSARVQLDFLAPLKTLTLTRPTSLRSWEGSRSIFRFCSVYNITHLNLVLAPSRSIARDALLALGPQLVSFRLSLGRPGWGSACALSQTPHLWPTKIVHGVSLPNLKHLELSEELQNYFDGDEGKTHQNELIDDPDAWRTSCPVIETFVWRPAQYHRMLAEGESWYSWAMQDFTRMLFKMWPTLDRFERLRLQREPAPACTREGEEDGEVASYVAYIRNGFERVVIAPAVYDDHLWRRA
ncbi:hypothetical protein C8Q74DRAFT_1264167 [Fomes fomentarius]|nr:hypothetical protein C8Q74DRAFT_1264167 [Fomes fomentarius]